MSRAVYEQFRVQVKQEILQKLDCGLDFSDGQVRRLIDERLPVRQGTEAVLRGASQGQ